MYDTFSSSIAFRARTLSALAVRSKSSSSSSNFLFAPVLLLLLASTSSVPEFIPSGGFEDSAIVLGARGSIERGLLLPGASSNPACVISKSFTALFRSSSSLSSSPNAASRSASRLVFSERFSSFFWARMFANAHSRQKTSPRWHDTGSRAISRQRPQDPKGRKDSRFRRAEEEDQADLARLRSWDVKTGRVLFRLPL